MSDCPCGSGNSREACCGRYLDGDAEPPTAEALMRARYAAHVGGDIDYIVRTHEPAGRGDIDREATRRWAERARWLGLEILHVQGGGEGDDAGTVEFVAHYRERGERRRHHEVAHFRRGEDGEWLFAEGRAPDPVTVQRRGPRVGRNDPCPCGSGRKYKKCCGASG